MAPTRACALTWNAAGSGTCWRWPPPTRSPPPRALPGPPDRRPAAPPGVAAVFRRRGRQGPPLLRLGLAGHRPGPAGHRWLLIRRNRHTGELAFYRCYSPRHVPLPALVKIAGTRWTTEENFQAGKGLAGLDEHQVRRWGSWYRWTTLAMLALAFLTIAAATEHTRHPAPAGQIPLTRNEIAAPVQPP